MTRRQVFISYSGRNAVEASLLQYALEGLLIDEEVVAWSYERDTSEDIIIVDPQHKLKAGSNIRKVIRDAISSASKVVIIASDNSSGSQWVNYEAGMAVALEKPIVVMRSKGSGKTALYRALRNVQAIQIEGEKGLRVLEGLTAQDA